MVKLLTPIYENTIVNSSDRYYTMLFKFTDNFSGDEYFESLFVEVYPLKDYLPESEIKELESKKDKKDKKRGIPLNIKLLKQIPNFLHELIIKLTNKSIEMSRKLFNKVPSTKVSPSEALIMGESLPDNRTRFIEAERILKPQLGDPSLRVYEDHELSEFIDNFFKQAKYLFRSQIHLSIYS